MKPDSSQVTQSPLPLSTGPVQLATERLSSYQEYDRYLGSFLRDSPVVARRGTPGVADLLFGDPHDAPLPEVELSLIHI